jgi:hypothetical protein
VKNVFVTVVEETRGIDNARGNACRRLCQWKWI